TPRTKETTMSTSSIAQSPAQADHGPARSKTLLTAGVVAGPLYIVMSLLQAGVRGGFDMRRHPFSLLTTGHLGWIQAINFVVAGLLMTAGALGLRQALRGGRGGTWGPRLVAAFGLSFVSG